MKQSQPDLSGMCRVMSIDPNNSDNMCQQMTWQHVSTSVNKWHDNMCQPVSTNDMTTCVN